MDGVGSWTKYARTSTNRKYPDLYHLKQILFCTVPQITHSLHGYLNKSTKFLQVRPRKKRELGGLENYSKIENICCPLYRANFNKLTF